MNTVIPTASHVLRTFSDVKETDNTTDCEKAMVEFAKLHVEKAMKRIIHSEWGEQAPQDKIQLVFDSYPLDNIK